MTPEIGKKYHDPENKSRYMIPLYEHHKHFLVEYRNKKDDSYCSVLLLDKTKISIGFLPYTPKKTLKRYGFFIKLVYDTPTDGYIIHIYNSLKDRDQKYKDLTGVVPRSKFEVSVEVDDE